MNPSASAAAANEETHSHIWQCPSCTYNNDDGKLACLMCQTERRRTKSKHDNSEAVGKPQGRAQKLMASMLKQRQQPKRDRNDADKIENDNNDNSAAPPSVRHYFNPDAKAFIPSFSLNDQQNSEDNKKLSPQQQRQRHQGLVLEEGEKKQFIFWI